jgi:hypothetical protein
MPEPTRKDFTNEPITPGALLDRALAATDVPKRGDASLDEWAAGFDNPELKRRAEQLVEYALAGDVANLRHWAHQVEDAFLRSVHPGKDPRHV